MDVMRINKTDFRPRDLVEGYNSMIWTERYRLPGEFEMKTHQVAKTKAALELGSLITLRDTSEVMIVESHLLARDGEGVPELTVSGRSLTSFVEMRNVVRMNMTDEVAGQSPGQRYRKPYRMKQDYTQAEAACLMLWNAFVSTLTTDATTPNAAGLYYRESGTSQFFDQRAARHAIPNTIVTDSSTKTGNRKRRWLNNGPITEPVERFLRLGDLGVRTIRPDSGACKIITSTSAGVLTKTNVASTDKLRWDVYNGVRRTVDQSAVQPLVFRYDAGHLEEPTYLDSIKGYRNMVVGDNSFGAGTSAIDWTQFDVENAKGGLDARWGYIDGGVYDPAEGMNQAEWAHYVDDQEEDYLRKRMMKTIFDGKISVDSPHIYKTDYFLGDKVTLQAEYGIVLPMQIIEYVRTENREGEVGYPTMNLPQPEEVE